MTSRFSDHLLTGAVGDIPDAGTVPEGTLYMATDEDIIYQSNGVDTWDEWMPAGAGGGSGTDLNPGTSFPGGPSTNDLCFRTDRGILYFYNGTRWLSVQQFEHHLGTWVGISATAAEIFTPVRAVTYDCWLEKLVGNLYAASGLSGSAYWTITAYSYDGASGSELAHVNNQSGSNAVHVVKEASIGALLGTGADAFSAYCAKTSSPGAFNGGAMLIYRLVG